MIATAEIKDSGIEWVNDIPAHWNVLPLFGMFYDKQIKNSEGIENNVLSLSYGKIIRRNIEDNFGLLPESFNTYQIVDDGDIIMRLTDLQNDKRSLRVGLVREKGIITSAYLCLSLLRNQNANNVEYFYYLLHTYDKYKIFYNLGGGVRQSMGFADLKRMPLIMPPKDEQDEIVQYIKAQEEKINLFIQKKQRFIELLKEQRQSLVDNSITINIAACKDIRLKYISGRIGDGLHGTPQYVDYSEFKFINGNNLINGTIVTSDETNCVTEEEFNKYDLKLKKGTILYSINGTIGNMAFYDGEPVVLGKSAAYIEPDEISKDVIDYDYLFHYLQTNRVMKYFLNATASTTIKNLSLFTLRNTPVLVPNTLEQQKQIVSHIKTETATIDTAIAKAEREIELIREYKEAMIAEAVMGKRKINFAH